MGGTFWGCGGVGCFCVLWTIRSGRNVGRRVAKDDNTKTCDGLKGMEVAGRVSVRT